MVLIWKKHQEFALLKEGLIKKCPIDWKAIKNLMKRVYTDIETAKRNINDDEECVTLTPIRKEAEDALKTAREFVEIIHSLIKEKNPQKGTY